MALARSESALGYAVRPPGDAAWPGVLVIHEAFGLNQHIREACDRVARAGFAVVAPDLYRGRPERLATYEERDKAIAMLKSLQDAEVLATCDQAVGTYPQVFTDVANLDGTLEARISTPNGLFEDEYFWDNVIDANTRNGGFDGAQCVINGTPLLLELDCIEDDADNIDLALERVPFTDIPGLNENGSSGASCVTRSA